MKGLSDSELLHDFAERRSETAFAEIVRRYVDLVYTASLRITGDAHLAKDVSQGVFVALANDSAKLANHPVLVGWLHRTACNIARQRIRTEVRRLHREREAAVMNEPSTAEASWKQISEELDSALGDLDDRDRDALLLRYFENKTAGEIAALQGVSAQAAQKRLGRALDKLREKLASRGVTAGTVGLAAAISTHAVQAAPDGVATACSNGALELATAAAAKASGVMLFKKAFVVVVAALLIAALAYQINPDGATKVEDSKFTTEVATPKVRTVEPALEGGDTSGNEMAESEPPEAEGLVGIAGGRIMGQVQLPPDIDWMFYNAERDGLLPHPLTTGRKLSTTAADAAQLTEKERSAIQQVIDTTWEEAEEDVVSRIKLDETASSPEQGRYVYSIPPAPDRDKNRLLVFQMSLAEEVGDDRSLKLCKMFDPDDGLIGIGGHDFRIEITIPAAGQGGVPRVESRKSNPDTGEKGFGSGGSVESFRLKYGDIIDFDAVTNPDD